MKKVYLSDYSENNNLFWIYRRRLSSDTGYHTQDFFEITVILGGQATHKVNGDEYPVSRHDILFLPQGESHKLGDSTTSTELKFINIGFNEDIYNIFAAALEINSPNELLSKVTVTDSKLTTIIERFSKVNCCRTTEEAIYECKILIMILLKEIKLNSRTVRTQMPPWLISVIKEMDNFHYVKEGVSKIYELSPYSKQYTINQFKSSIGMVPSAYINYRKIEYASRLLRTTNIDILCISMDCGYDNVEIFYRNFKQFNGTTPLKYRKKYHYFI